MGRRERGGGGGGGGEPREYQLSQTAITLTVMPVTPSIP